MQSDVVSGDACDDKFVNVESIGADDGGSVSETLVQEEGLRQEIGKVDLRVVPEHLCKSKESSSLEVECFGEGDSREISEHLSDKRESTSLGVECVGGGGDSSVVSEHLSDKRENTSLGVECVGGGGDSSVVSEHLSDKRENTSLGVECVGGGGDSSVISEHLSDKGETSTLEVGCAGRGDLRAGLEDLNDERKTSSLEVQKGVSSNELSKVEEGLSDGCAVKEGKDLGVDVVAVEGSFNDKNSPVKASFNSFAQKLFPNSSVDDKCGKEVEVEKAVNDSSCEVNDRSYELKSSASTSDKEDCENHDRCDKEVLVEKTVDASLPVDNQPSVVLESLAATSGKVDSGCCDNNEGDSGDKGVHLVVDLDECVSNDKKNSKKKGRVCASDLVWGKVRSHPWWPAQIFEPGDASDKARKYSKSKGYFVCYFGDQTFAWNGEATVKPFFPNFSQMIKQTNMEALRHAVDCALEETSRRVEFGLSCRCIVDDVYNKLKTQVVENAGIREESRIQEGGDRFLTASSFEPVKFLNYVKDLAQGPHANVDRLEHVVSRAQMAAFYRWKGIYHLAEFGLLIGYVNNEVDAPVTELTAKKEELEVTGDMTSTPGAMEEDDNRLKKRKKMSSDSDHSIKKVKCLSDLVGKKGIRKKDDKESERKVGSKSVSSSAQRQKEAKSRPIDSRTKESSPSGTTLQFRETKPFSRVGESILRVADQLNQPSPILKRHVSSREETIKDEGNSKECGKHNFEYSSLDVVLSELHLAAIEPLKEHSLLNLVTFISGFRNSIVPDNELLQKHEESGEEDTVARPQEESSGSEPACLYGTELKAKTFESAITTTSAFKAAEDASCMNDTIRAIEQQTSLSDGEMAVVEPALSEADGILSGSKEVDSIVSSPQQRDESENGVSNQCESDQILKQVDSPTALTLKFTDINSIPAEDKLNKIFSHFGPLKESETEILGKKHCARVVFKRRADAETAFSSSGKFEIFGPSLVCYQLNFAPSPRKSPSVEAKRRKKVDIPVGGNAARRSIIE